MLALPGSAYLYQGEELGLHEVPDIPGDQVPIFGLQPVLRGAEKGRDGLPCPAALDRRAGPSFGFGGRAATCPSRPGSARSAWRRGNAIPPRPCGSTATPCTGAVAWLITG